MAKTTKSDNPAKTTGDPTVNSAGPFDVIVIGAGPGGYVCAIRCAQLGMKVACVEREAQLGGTCLRVGCIPSKALLTASEHYHQATSELAAFGVTCGKVSLDLKTMMAHKDKVVSDNTAGVSFLFKKNKVTHLAGTGKITAPGTVDVNGKAYKAKHIVIATGSDSADVAGVKVDEKTIVSSTGALALTKVPKTMAVIGGGYIGLEMASIWSRLGAVVTVIEFAERILPGLDKELATTAARAFKKQKIAFKVGHKVTKAKRGTVTIEPVAGGKALELAAEVILVAVGRRPHTAGLGLETVGVKTDSHGFIVTDARFASTVEGIYAIGDVTTGPMLAHKAEEEGVALAECLAGQVAEVDHDIIPAVVYTEPEIAAVGQTEQALQEAGVAYKVGKFPFSANGRARASRQIDGFAKILADEKTDQILGVHIVGAHAGTMIAEAALAMAFAATAQDIALTCHAHPTLNEALKEAALAVAGHPLHI
ncbi:MAG: dihydrolipoyl dehydrogenase [Pseudomonadota bacterium]